MNLNEKTVKELQSILKSRGLPVHYRHKSNLVKRLLENFGKSDPLETIDESFEEENSEEEEQNEKNSKLSKSSSELSPDNFQNIKNNKISII